MANFGICMVYMLVSRYKKYVLNISQIHICVAIQNMGRLCTIWFHLDNEFLYEGQKGGYFVKPEKTSRLVVKPALLRFPASTVYS